MLTVTREFPAAHVVHEGLTWIPTVVCFRVPDAAVKAREVLLCLLQSLVLTGDLGHSVQLRPGDRRRGPLTACARGLVAGLGLDQ